MRARPLLSGHYKVLQAYLFVFPALAIFSRISDYFQCRIVFRCEDLDAGCTNCTEGVMCACIHILTHTYVILYHLSILNEHEFILISQIEYLVIRFFSDLPQLVSF